MPSTGVIRWPTDGLILCPGKNLLPSHMQHSSKIVPKVLDQQIKTLVADGFLTVLPCANRGAADLRVVGKLLTAPAFCLPVSAEEVSTAPVEKQGVVIQKVFHRDAVKGGELVRQFEGEGATKLPGFKAAIVVHADADRISDLTLHHAQLMPAPA